MLPGACYNETELKKKKKNKKIKFRTSLQVLANEVKFKITENN